ncbi:MAG: type II secretion system protein [Candidatus Sungbacteria bacterium]|nr:type II secretion system protein [Candidatus Sungbacteria bacterium]
MNQKTGFTLIELLVVISIISLLASIVLASLNSARAKARWARTVADFVQIDRAAEFFLDSERFYPCDSPPGYDASFNSGGRYMAPPTELGVTCQNKGLVETGLLPLWPKPPCGAGWDYDWENWSSAVALPSGPGQVVRVTLRDPPSTYAPVFHYCIYNTHNSSQNACGGQTGDAAYTLGGTMINGVSSGLLSC